MQDWVGHLAQRIEGGETLTSHERMTESFNVSEIKEQRTKIAKTP